MGTFQPHLRRRVRAWQAAGKTKHEGSGRERLDPTRIRMPLWPGERQGPDHLIACAGFPGTGLAGTSGHPRVFDPDRAGQSTPTVGHVTELSLRSDGVHQRAMDAEPNRPATVFRIRIASENAGAKRLGVPEGPAHVEGHGGTQGWSA
jgi:hypothetical protein